MAEPGSLLDDAELEGVRATVDSEIAAYDVLCCTWSLALPPETAPPGVINSFSWAYRFENRLARGIYRTEREIALSEGRNYSGEESIESIGAEGRGECIGDVQLRGAGLAGT